MNVFSQSVVFKGFTCENSEPFQADLDHLEGFLGLVQRDGLSALLLDIKL